MDWESVVEYVNDRGVTSVDQYYDMRQTDCASSGESRSDYCMGCEMCVPLSTWLEKALEHHLEGKVDRALHCVMYENLITSIIACDYECCPSAGSSQKKIVYIRKLMKVCMKMCTNKKQKTQYSTIGRTGRFHRRTVKA